MLNLFFDIIFNFIFIKKFLNMKYVWCIKMVKSFLYFCLYLYIVERYYNYLIYIVMFGVVLLCCDK